MDIAPQTRPPPGPAVSFRVRFDTRRLIAPPSTSGLLAGTLLFGLSLAPSLVPRPFALQGLVSGLSFTAGYACGALGRWLWDYLELPYPRERVGRWIWGISLGICLIVAAIFLWRAGQWQNSLRALMGMEEEAQVRRFTVGLMTVAIFSGVLLTARFIREVARAISGRLRRLVPPRVANLIGIVLTAILLWNLAEGAVVAGALRMVDGSYQALDELADDGLHPPESTFRSGSEASLVEWSELGRQGRLFVSSGPTTLDLAAFAGNDVMEPIRVYVGLTAADAPSERARVALEELKRTGAFERSVLVLVTPTGTGWVDPGAIAPLEYLFGGDVATVAVQYSYLPSAVALLAEGAYGAETARALFLEVYGHWTSLPPEQRPRLYLQGVSLGTLNSSLSFDLQDILADPFDGVLWSGPPFRTEAWVRATRDREPGSPAWLPRYRQGRVVRFMNQHGGFERSDEPWGPLRIGYLQYASDPITFFSVDAFVRQPEWMNEPRGPDVAPTLRWYPVVTGLQLAADMLVGDAPRGFGHNFSVAHYLDAWTQIAEPDGWNPTDLARLRAHLVEEERRIDREQSGD